MYKRIGIARTRQPYSHALVSRHPSMLFPGTVVFRCHEVPSIVTIFRARWDSEAF